ncbi:AAA domain-containing protein [Acinetobacter venetianus]|jgi:hypothetical protein|uniref:AAA domain-containing protein n=1 Tax=Acinetobacter venetianus TaxID=52133 RepID=UPI00384FEFF7
MSLLDNIPDDEKQKIDIKHQSEDVEIWAVYLDNRYLKVKHWKIEEKEEDQTIKEIWLNEVRQLNRLKSIGNSSRYLELLYKSHIDNKGYYLIYDSSPDVITLRQFIEEKLEQNIGSNRGLKIKLNYPWIHPIGLRKIENRIILWRNIFKIVKAIRILHEQGIVHRKISLDTILVDDSQDNFEENDKFKLSGFEWSIYLNSLNDVDYSSIMDGEIINSSISNDWISLGKVIEEIFNISDNEGLKLIRSEIDFINIMKNDLDEQVDLNSDLVEILLKNLINELPRYDNNNSIAYLTSNDSQSSEGYRKIRDKLKRFLKKELTYEEVFLFLEQDLDLSKIDVRQVEFDKKYTYLIKGKKLIYQVDSYKRGGGDWDFGYIGNIFDKYPVWSDYSDKVDSYNELKYIKKSKIPLIPEDVFFNWSVIINQFEKERILSDEEKSCLRGLILNHAIDTAIFMSQKYTVKFKKFDWKIVGFQNVEHLEDDNYYEIELINDSHKDKISRCLKTKKQREVFYSQFENEEISTEWIMESISDDIDRESDRSASLNYIEKKEGKLIFSSKMNLNIYFSENKKYLFYQKSIRGTDIQLERRNHALNKLIDQQNLLESLTDPAQCLQNMSYNYDLNESLSSLDESKRSIFKKLLTINPNFIVQGPPGVGKTHLVVTLVKQIFKDESNSKVILTAQSHSTVKVLYDAVKDKCDTNNLILIDAFDNEENCEDESTYKKITKKYIEKFSKSRMFNDALISSNEEVKKDLNDLVKEKVSFQFYDTILRAANLIFTTTNSKALETLIRNKINFDISIMEESAKVSGVELISPMLVSHKRILIGDYLQLPAFGEQLINNVCKNEEKFDYRLILKELNNINFRKDIFYKLGLNLQGDIKNDEIDVGDNSEENIIKRDVLKNLNKYFSIFRFLSKESEKINDRSSLSFGDTISTQYRMHPDISKIVSKTVYGGRVKDNEDQKNYYLKINSSPIVFKNHKFSSNINSGKAVIWVNVTDKNDNQNLVFNYEDNYVNEKEIKIIRELLKSMHKNDNYAKNKKIGIQVLSPYRKQVSKLNINLKNQKLNEGISIENGSDIARTVDSFQGDEADVIIISLVRHNSYTPYQKALGFLMDMRRMNVLLSRAKYKMIIVGCFKMFKFWSDYLDNNPEFLREITDEMQINNLKFLKDFVELATPDYNLMLDSSVKIERKEFNFINFISSDKFLESNCE